ncbi:hypothetical protein SU69_08710 [Thermosipho melanesiensis]|uniref:Uncharacterized protein-like protein n=2 Tax=Thermosipho melanesiensis TaxID=46541 RepID=A6LNR3_THEM4|nr:DUF2202 domain-containing protein [Thermosipho melanesiensis]ABR31564.1 Uncharacterized protein-like protein [Thermosipho melanesiensis BI429]APT74596.1 hypothetical protein BW47_09085 [Thermosipho melanesiensis]OOC35301.1 hypothetical protein SU69_08710 [Thermosipho melanesiensis]OOC35520.1 hypothetical protein SU70_08720 [Thermosipho melanesiensis]OOC36556.1 hypothetical protein SU68_08775 [Thermosipho melanesiensis]
MSTSLLVFGVNTADIVNLLPYETLSVSETESIMQMRKEEKLARDVYLVFYDLWGIRVFSNIAGAEQQHMDAVLTLIKKYDSNDPIKVDERGIFEDENLQALYNQLVEQGSKSLEDALIVGATIEDLDIYDLEEFLKITDNQDIEFVYKNLIKGSENHMRAFVSQLSRFSKTYTPKYIFLEKFNEIISN